MAIIKIKNPAIDLDAAEIPNLDTSKITTGTLADARIPNLDTAKITTGQFADARIADLDATKLTGTITPSDNTISLAKLTATGTKDATTFLRGDNTFASAGGDNTPSFLAYQSSNQNILNSGWTQLTFDTETYDTNSDFASSTFTPTEAGKYLIYGHLYLSSLDDTFRVMHQIRKNNSEIFVNLKSSGGTQDHTLESFVVAEANGTSDYFTIFASQNTGGTNRPTSGPNTRFGAFKIIE